MKSEVKNRNLVAAMSYLLAFVTGLVVLAVEKDDKFIRFHAMQSTFVFGAFFILNILVGIIFQNLGLAGVIGTLINAVIFLAELAVWIISMFRAFSGEIIKWPYFGDLAQRKVTSGRGFLK